MQLPVEKLDRRAYSKKQKKIATSRYSETRNDRRRKMSPPSNHPQLCSHQLESLVFRRAKAAGNVLLINILFPRKVFLRIGFEIAHLRLFFPPHSFGVGVP